MTQRLPGNPAAIRRLVRDKLDTDAAAGTVVYSGPSGPLGRIGAAPGQPRIGNHERALAHVAATGCNIIDQTQAGKMLGNANGDVYQTLIAAQQARVDARFPNRQGAEYQQAMAQAIERGTREADSVFRLTSRELCMNLKGPVRTFVIGAGADRVFRRDELITLVNNRDVPSINGVPRGKFTRYLQQDLYGPAAPQGKPGAAPILHRTYRAICLSELRQDRAQALRIGNRDLIRDSVVREEIYRRQQAERRAQLAKLNEDPAQTLQRIAARTDRLTAMAQRRNRQEAAEGMMALIDARVASGQLSVDKGAIAKSKLDAKLADPERAYRIKTGLQMAQAYHAIRAKRDPYAIKDYARLFTRLILDTRLIRAVRQMASPATQTPAQKLLAAEDGQIFVNKLRTTKNRAYDKLRRLARDTDIKAPVEQKQPERKRNGPQRDFS